jgi:hypothetical protein
MPLTYTGGAGIFTHLGAIIARINSYTTLGSTTLPADLAALLAAFGTTWLPEEGVAAYYDAMETGVTSWRQGLAGFADRRLLDPATVLAQFSAQLDTGAGLDQVLPALVRQMQLDSQTVKACTCTTGPVAALSSNQGNGTAYLTLALDGYNAPVLGALPNVYYNGLASQFCVPSETMTLECIADSAMDGLAAGDEAWQWTGGTAYPDLDWHTEGSGIGPSIHTDNGSANLLTNGGLETWSGGVPTGWTVAAGTVTQDQTFPFGSGSAAALAGGATVSLQQAVSPALLTSNRRYRFSLALRQVGATGGTVRVGFQLGGVTPPSGMDIPAASLTGNWSLWSKDFSVPQPLPSTYTFEVKVEGLNAGGKVYVDSVAFVPVTYHGGVGVNVVAGSYPFFRGDRLSFPVTNDSAGKFQSFFRRHFLTQLPSIKGPPAQGTALLLPLLLLTSTGAESISDSLVA